MAGKHLNRAGQGGPEGQDLKNNECKTKKILLNAPLIRFHSELFYFKVIQDTITIYALPVALATIFTSLLPTFYNQSSIELP